MALAADHSSLPPAQAKGGTPPDPTPRFSTVLLDALERQRDEDGEKATANGTRIRHSDAGKCARAIALKAAGFPAAPMDPAGVHVTNLGTLIHEAWQEALASALGADNVEIEPTCQVDGLDASGHIDAIITLTDSDGEPTWRVAYELKTVGGFGYKKAVGERGEPEGPKHGAVVQGCLNAYAADCDELVIGYLATEAISRQAAERAANKGAHIDELRRFTAEWTYSRDDIERIAKPEVARLQRVLDLLDDGYLAPTKIPDPEIPERAFVADPRSGRWEVYGDSPDAESDEPMAVLDTGTTWQCAYCPWQEACAAIDIAGPVRVEKATQLIDDAGVVF